MSTKNIKSKFLEKKQAFDKSNESQNCFKSIIPVHLTKNKEFNIRNKKGVKNEEYYKWQFFYALINSGLYKKDYVGSEIYFPKGNKNSAPIKMDGAIFDSPEWFEWYKKFHNEKIEIDYVDIGTMNRNASKGAQRKAIIREAQIPELIDLHGLKDFKLKNKRQVLRNCVLPKIGLSILKDAINSHKSSEENK